MTKMEEFEMECELIAEQCAEEGYPDHGSNYDLRVASLMQTDYYKELFEDE